METGVCPELVKPVTRPSLPISSLHLNQPSVMWLVGLRTRSPGLGWVSLPHGSDILCGAPVTTMPLHGTGKLPKFGVTLLLFNLRPFLPFLLDFCLSQLAEF